MRFNPNTIILENSNIYCFYILLENINKNISRNRKKTFLTQNNMRKSINLISISGCLYKKFVRHDNLIFFHEKLL